MIRLVSQGFQDAPSLGSHPTTLQKQFFMSSLKKGIHLKTLLQMICNKYSKHTQLVYVTFVS
jgi:hypothetical protein